MAEAVHTVSIAEFRERNEQLVREVQATREPIYIMDGGAVVALLLAPVVELTQHDSAAIAHDLAIMAEIDRMANNYASKVPPGTTAVDVVREQRRD